MISFWPAPLQQLLEGSVKSESGDSVLSSRDPSSEQAALRKDALLGHLLRLAAKGAGGETQIPPHALPALASQLVATGILPRHYNHSPSMTQKDCRRSTQFTSTSLVRSVQSSTNSAGGYIPNSCLRHVTSASFCSKTACNALREPDSLRCNGPRTATFHP